MERGLTEYVWGTRASNLVRLQPLTEKQFGPQKGMKNGRGVCCLCPFAVSDALSLVVLSDTRRTGMSRGCRRCRLVLGLRNGKGKPNQEQECWSSAGTRTGCPVSLCGANWMGTRDIMRQPRDRLTPCHLHFHVELRAYAVRLGVKWWRNREETSQ